MKKIALTVLAAAATCGVWAQEEKQASDEIKQEIKAVLDGMEAMFGHNFVVQVKSKEISDMMAKHIAKSSPMPVGLSHFLVHHQDGEVTVQAKLSAGGLPPEFQKTIEQAVNPVVQASPIGQLMQGVASDNVGQAVQFLMEHDSFTVVRDEEELLDVRVDEINEPAFQDQVLTSARLRMDRKNKLVTIVKLSFEGDKLLAVKLEYKPVKAPGAEEEVFMQSRNTIVQQGFFEESAGLVPKRFTLEYGKYKFK